jgi:hypothetical protein
MIYILYATASLNMYMQQMEGIKNLAPILSLVSK